jgi:site-specific recombinase XerD
LDYRKPRRVRVEGLVEVREEFKQPLDRMIRTMRYRHYAYRTEETYVGWVERYLGRCRSRKLAVPSAETVRGFLEELSTEGNVSASTQNQALNALVFFFREGLGQELGELGEFEYAKRPRRLPVVLRPEEVERL